jgi:hypothetical protein
LNLAACYEEAGKIARALTIYREVAELARERGQAGREALALERVRVLETAVPRLRLDFDGERPLSISLDGKELDRSEWEKPLPLDPGPHLVTVQLDAKASWTRRVELEAGQLVRLVVAEPRAPRELPGVDHPTAGSAPLTQVSQASEPDGAGFRGAALVLGGVGTSAALVGGVFGVLAQRTYADSKDECGPRGACTVEGRRLREKSFAQADVSTLAFAVAGVGLAAGTTLWLVAPRSRSRGRDLGRVNATVSALHVGLVVGAEFQ